MTDPKNADYEMESGGTRNYEVWHDEAKTNAEFDKQQEEDEKMDSMKALENRVAESQREMAEMDALEEIRAMNQRHVGLMKGGRRIDAAQAVLRAREAAVGKGPADEEDLNENGLTNEEEDLVKSIKFRAASDANPEHDDSIRRLDEEDEILAERRRREEAEALINKSKGSVVNGDLKKSNNLPIFKVKRKKKKVVTADANTVEPEPKRAKAVATAERKEEPTTNKPREESDSDGGGGALSGLLGYGSDSS